MWSRSRQAADLDRIKARLQGLPERRAKAAAKSPALIETTRSSTGRVVLNLLERLRLRERLKSLIEQAGLKWDVARMMHGSLALFLTGFTMVWRLAPDYRAAAPAVALGMGALPLLYVFRKRRKRLRKFEEQFPDSLEFLARSMRAGHAFSVSLEMLHTEFQEPLAGEFRRAFDEQNLGLPLDVALQKLAERVPLIDVHFFVSAVLLQKRTGGNLAELLDRLAYLIRERFKLRGRIRAISAHGKMTGSVLSLVPIAVGVMMCWVNPDYVRFFVEDDTGKLMLGGGIALQLLGYAIIKKIVSIEI
jgi:tight adherence protein B